MISLNRVLESMFGLNIRPGSQLDMAIRKFSQNKLAMFGLIGSLIYVFISLVGPFFMPYDPTSTGVGPNLAPPSTEHWFGTDHNGRDIFSRVIEGARISLFVGFSVVAVACVVGVAAGLISGRYGGIIDGIIMRTIEVIYVFPSILLALIVVAILGQGLDRVLLALGLAYAIEMARITRGAALSVREEEYILASESYGEHEKFIMLREMLPNMMSAVMVQATLIYAFAILAEASLSYLGLSAQPPTPTWGIMVSQGQTYIGIAPWVTIAPGIAILFAVLAFTFLGIGLRDALDPKTEVNAQ